MAVWREMKLADLAGVLAVADMVHPDLPEEHDVLAERLKLFARGCHVLEEDGTIVGYAISHPISRGLPPKLNGFLGSLPAEPCDYYLHDVAILPSQRGGGYARQVIEKMIETGRSYEAICLISVYGTQRFWQGFGFTAADDVSADRLAYYGEDALFMRFMD